MVWRDGAEVFEQPVFTYDGEGAVLLVWDTGDEWVVTFVASDDAAAYRALEPTLDWAILGRPVPFVRCGGLWVQPLATSDGRVAAIGVRDREDVEGRADQPLFVWGATVEALFDRPARALRLPVGMPATDGSGPIQYFVNGEIVRSQHAPSERLTTAQLIRHCSTA
jgi:hypothetical protein